MTDSTFTVRTYLQNGKARISVNCPCGGMVRSMALPKLAAFVREHTACVRPTPVVTPVVTRRGRSAAYANEMVITCNFDRSKAEGARGGLLVIEMLLILENEKITVEEFLAAGGRRATLKFQVAAGNISIN